MFTIGHISSTKSIEYQASNRFTMKGLYLESPFAVVVVVEAEVVVVILVVVVVVVRT